jgi:hypothetical protein
VEVLADRKVRATAALRAATPVKSMFDVLHHPGLDPRPKRSLSVMAGASLPMPDGVTTTTTGATTTTTTTTTTTATAATPAIKRGAALTAEQKVAAEVAKRVEEVIAENNRVVGELTAALTAATAELERMKLDAAARIREDGREFRELRASMLEHGGWARTFTRFRDYESFMSYHDSVVAAFVYPSTEARGRPSKLATQDEMFLFFYLLRTGSQQCVAGLLFGISTSTVSRLWNKWVDVLYTYQRHINPVPSQAQVFASTPHSWKVHGVAATFLAVDTTLVRIDTPANKGLSKATYTDYGGGTCAAFLIGVTPCGAVGFISAAFPGSISDPVLTTASGLLEFLEAGSDIMADRGFNIRALLLKLGCYLYIPTKLGGRAQFSVEEHEYDRIIAHLRIHIERVNAGIYQWGYFDGVIAGNAVHSLHKVVFIAGTLLNFGHPFCSTEDAKEMFEEWKAAHPEFVGEPSAYDLLYNLGGFAAGQPYPQ